MCVCTEDVSSDPRKVDVRLTGNGNSNSHGARPVHLIITMIKWTRTSRLLIKNSLSLYTEDVSSDRAFHQQTLKLVKSRTEGETLGFDRF